MLRELFRRTSYLANNLLTIPTRRIHNSNKQYEELQHQTKDVKTGREEDDSDEAELSIKD